MLEAPLLIIVYFVHQRIVSSLVENHFLRTYDYHNILSKAAKIKIM